MEQSGHFVGLNIAQTGSLASEVLLQQKPPSPAGQLLANPKGLLLLLRLAALKAVQAWHANRPQEVTRLLRLLEAKSREAHASPKVVRLIGLAAKESAKANKRRVVLQLLKLAEKKGREDPRLRASQPQQQSSGQGKAKQKPLILGRVAASEEEKRQDAPLQVDGRTSATAASDGRREAGGEQEQSSGQVKTLAEVENVTQAASTSPAPQTSTSVSAAKGGAPSSQSDAKTSVDQKGANIAAARKWNVSQKETQSMGDSKPPGDRQGGVIHVPASADNTRHEVVFDNKQHYSKVRSGMNSVEQAVVSMKTGLGDVKRDAKAVKVHLKDYERSIESLAHTLDQADQARDKWYRETFDHFEQGDPYRMYPFLIGEKGGFATVDEAKLAHFEELIARKDRKDKGHYHR